MRDALSEPHRSKGGTQCTSALFLIAICCLLLSPLAAQDAATGAIHGTVLDPAGAHSCPSLHRRRELRHRLPLLHHVGCEGALSALDLLPPGDYPARAIAEKCLRRNSPLHVDVGAAAELEFHLDHRRAAGKCHRLRRAKLVDTQSSAVSTLIDERAIADLSLLNGRRFSDLMLLSPGVTTRPTQPHLRHQR